MGSSFFSPHGPFESLYHSSQNPQLVLSLLPIPTPTSSNSEQDAYYLSLLYKSVLLSPFIWFVIYGATKGIELLYCQLRSKEVTGNRWGDLFEVFIQESDILEAERSKLANGESPISSTEERITSPSLSSERTRLNGVGLSHRRRRKWGLLIPLALEFIGWSGWSVWILCSEGSDVGSLLRYAGDVTWSEYLSSSAVVVPILFTIVWLTTFLKELLTPTLSPQSSPYILLLFLLQISSAILYIVCSVYNNLSMKDFQWIGVVGRSGDALLCAWALWGLLTTPLASSSSLIDSESSSPSEKNKPRRPASPEDSNTLLGALTYAWMEPIMTLARSRSLKSVDVWGLARNNRSEVLSLRFGKLREKSLLGKILHASARDVLIDFTLKLLAVLLNYSRPFFIQKLLERLTDLSATSSPSPDPLVSNKETQASTVLLQQAQIFAFLAFTSMILRSLAELKHFHHARRIGMRLRSILTIEVFEKALTRRRRDGTSARLNMDKSGLEKEGEGESKSASVGKVVGLISDDTNRILRMGCDSHLIYGAPLEIVLGIVLLYSLMGWSSLVGFSILVIAVPINYSLGKRSIHISRSRSAARDDRQASLQELISAIRTIKFFGWIALWTAKTSEKRNIELEWMVKDWVNRFYLTSLWAVVSLVVPLLSFYSFVIWQGRELTVAIAFTALTLFSMIRGPLNQIPEFGIRLLQTQVSIQRIESFFAEKDVAPWISSSTRSQDCRNLGFKEDATFCWSTTPNKDSDWVLGPLNIAFPTGNLTLIKGETGSGKSSLLLALLGELEVTSGTVDLPRAISYCAQHPWLESTTIRDNILFGSPYIHRRYRDIIEACALLPDLVLFPDGDLTHIGQRGVALSGGQQARIAFARAIYAPTQHVLLDDVLAAVDSHTAKFIFNNVLRGHLLEGRTCLLVTHNVDLVISGASYVVELVNGKVVHQGSVTPDSEEMRLKLEDQVERKKRLNERNAGLPDDDPKVETAETWTTGEVKRSIYATYLKASSYILWALILLLILARPALSFAEQYWLRLWGEASNQVGKVDSAYYLVGYAVIGASSALVLLLSTVVIYVNSLRASRSIFSSLLEKVVRAPPRWFDITPQGRITNRFTNDISIVDESLASNFSTFAANFVAASASLIIVTLIIPQAFVPIACFSVVYSIIFVRYLSVNRDLNRIAATTASPIFSGFQEVLVGPFRSRSRTVIYPLIPQFLGITTIRAFARESSFRQTLCFNIDETLALWYCSCTLDVWLSIRTQFLSACCLLATASFAVHTQASAGMSGIAITSALGVIQSLDYLCTAYGRIVTSLNSMERITEYLDLPQERSDGICPPANWPSSSNQAAFIQVRGLVIRYSDELPDVLHGVSFDVKPRERIAICGRTGSGKSTLAMSFLRFVDPISGTITIDGLDITTVKLQDLRQRVTFLPQEATLFTGTIRSNLDPFSAHSDSECLDALRRVHLLPSNNSSSGSSTPTEFLSGSERRKIELRTQVSAGGGNFSAGERQLIALARALLRDSRIIIFDESTASIDFALDTKIQATIRSEFHDACLITIAHRLRTVIDYDRILVLEAGQVLEFDSPAILLQVEKGAFRTMCQESGDYESLMRLGKDV